MKIAIVGGGMTGLVAGYRLLQQGNQVTIFEKNERVGGLLAGFEVNETYLEKAYHHIFKTDSDIINLIDELGLIAKLKWYEGKTAIYYKNKLYPFNGPIDLLKFEPLPFVDRIRTGVVSLWLQKDNSWQKYQKTAAYTWMKKWNGQKAYSVMWEPLLKGKFHDYYQEVSMAWLWARIHTRGNSKDKGELTEKLGYMEGGFEQLVTALTTKITELGGKIKTQMTVEDIPGLLKKFDKVISTGPIKDITYLAAVELVFTSKQSLSRYYWHNINDTTMPFLAFIQHTNLVGTKNYDGDQVYYLGTYVPQDHFLMKASEKEIIDLFFKNLKKIFPAFDKKQVKQKWVFKLAKAQHVVTTDYHVPGYETGIKNLYQANFAQIFPEDRGTNFAVREGNKIAKLI